MSTFQQKLKKPFSAFTSECIYPITEQTIKFVFYPPSHYTNVHQHLSPSRLIVHLIRWIVDKTKEPVISAILTIARCVHLGITVFSAAFPFIKYQFEENRWYSPVPLLHTIYDYYNGVIDSNYPDRMKKVNSAVAVCQQGESRPIEFSWFRSRGFVPGPDCGSKCSLLTNQMCHGVSFPLTRQIPLYVLPYTRIACGRFINNGISGRMVSLCLIIHNSLKGMFEFVFWINF